MSERELTDLTAQTPQTESDSVGASDSSPTISPMDSPMDSPTDSPTDSSTDSPSPSPPKSKACDRIFITFVVVLAASTMVLAACVLYNPDCAKMFYSTVHKLKSQAKEVVIWVKSIFWTGTQGDNGLSPTTIQDIQVKEDDNVESDSLLHDLWSGTTSKMDQIIEWIKSLFWTETHGDNGFSTTSKIDQIIDKVKAAQGQADTNENVTERTESETTFTTSTPITPFSNNFQFNLTSYLARQSLHRGTIFQLYIISLYVIIIYLDEIVLTGGIESLPTVVTGKITSIKCQTDSPMVWGAVGGLLLGHTPILCGGINEIHVSDSETTFPTSTPMTPFSNYFQFNRTTGDDSIPSAKCVHLVMPPNKILPNLQTARAFAASAVLANETILWVTGGYTSVTKEPLDSTELIDIEKGTNVEGPLLPKPLLFHCLAQLNKDQVILVGGMNDQEEAENGTYLFDYPSRTWKVGPPLNHARYGHGCGSFFNETSLGHFELVVMVASGKNSWEERLPVEQINVIRDNEWSLGKNPNLKTISVQIKCLKKYIIF